MSNKNNSFFSFLKAEDGWQRIKYKKSFDIIDPVHAKKITVKKGSLGGLVKNTKLPNAGIFISENSSIENCIIKGIYCFLYDSVCTNSTLSDCILSECSVSGTTIGDSWVINSTVSDSSLEGCHISNGSTITESVLVDSEVCESYLFDSKLKSCVSSKGSKIQKSNLCAVLVSDESIVDSCHLECFNILENSEVANLTYLTNSCNNTCYDKYKLISAVILEQFDFAAFGDDFAYRSNEKQSSWVLANRKIDIRRSFDRFNMPPLNSFQFKPHLLELAKIIALNSKRFYANKESFILNSKGNNSFHEWQAAYFYMAANFCLHLLSTNFNSFINIFHNLISFNISIKEIDIKKLHSAYQKCCFAIFDPVTIESFDKAGFPVNMKNNCFVVVNPNKK